MAIDIVDLPIQNSDFPVRYVSVPEGITPNQSSAVADRSRDRKNHATNEMLYIYIHIPVIYHVMKISPIINQPSDHKKS